MKKNINLILVKHSIVGIIVFYFLIHPLTMVIYWFEYNADKFSLSLLFKVLVNSFIDSFSFHMMGMSVAFLFIGAVSGVTSGFYYRTIVKKNILLKRQEEQLERNLESIIKGGENNQVEFKSSLRYDYIQQKLNKDLEKVFLKVIAGFLNGEGGILLIGVDDNGNILGLEKDYSFLRKKDRDGFELKLMQLISTQIGTEFCYFVQVSFYQVESKDVCSVDVKSSPMPAYLNIEGKTVFYLRIGNSTKELTVEETVNYLNFNKKRQSA